MTGIKPGFRFDINALRAIAVVAVLLYHFHVPLSGGGFSGVDIFFVISGYLMTSIILKGLEKGNFSIMEFYKKRIQRIMPALIFLIVALMVGCFFIYLPQDYLKIAENSTASLLFLSNIHYAMSGSYFGASADTNMLLHTWSLAVEWQFYILLPLALVLLNRYFKNRILRSAPFQFFGKISYSLYLWHWPVFVISNYVGVPSNPLTTICLLALSVLLGYLSYRYIESIRFPKNRQIVFAAGGFAMLAGFAAVTSLNEGLFERKTLSISAYNGNDKATQIRQYAYGTCFMTSGHDGIEDFAKAECLALHEDEKNILLIGDSHAAEFSESLKDYFKKRKINMGQATASGCLPVVGLADRGNCSEVFRYIYDEFLPENARNIDGVIISANWVRNDQGQLALLEDIRNTQAYLDKLGIPSVIIGQTESYRINYSSIAAIENEHDVKISKNYLDKEPEEINQFLKKNLDGEYIDIYMLDHIQEISSGNVPYMSDQNHLTKFGTDQVCKTIFENQLFRDLLTE